MRTIVLSTLNQLLWPLLVLPLPPRKRLRGAGCLRPLRGHIRCKTIRGGPLLRCYEDASNSYSPFALNNRPEAIFGLLIQARFHPEAHGGGPTGCCILYGR